MITWELENMARSEDLDHIKYKYKATDALFPYAVWRERGRDHRMVDALLGIARAPKIGTFMTEPIDTLFNEASPDSPDRVVALMAPYVGWKTSGFNKNIVAWWAAAALAVPYTEEVGQSVVDATLQIASIVDLKPWIPVNIWARLKKRPSLPPICKGRSEGTTSDVVRRVRELGDVEILESYLFLVWSEWDVIHSEGLTEMCSLIREDFGGIGMGRHREVLVGRLDRVLEQLDRGLGHLEQHKSTLDEGHILTAKRQYGGLREVLTEVDGEALEILTRRPFGLINLFNSLTPADIYRIPLDAYLCAFMSVVARPQHLFLVPRTPYFQISGHIRRPSPNPSKNASLATSRSQSYATLRSSVEGGSAGGRTARVVICISMLSRVTSLVALCLCSHIYETEPVISNRPSPCVTHAVVNGGSITPSLKPAYVVLCGLSHLF